MPWRSSDSATKPRPRCAAAASRCAPPTRVHDRDMRQARHVYIGGDLGKAMKAAGIAGDVGSATGYVLRFSNGLVAYLSGDTGILADQRLVIRDYYHAQLVVMNMGDGFTTGPAEAAYVVNELVQPASVIPSHANEAGTVDGKVRPGSKTEAFVKAARMPVHVPL